MSSHDQNMIQQMDIDNAAIHGDANFDYTVAQCSIPCHLVRKALILVMKEENLRCSKPLRMISLV